MAENLGKTTAHEWKSPLPVDVRHSKTFLLKLSSIWPQQPNMTY